MKKRLLTITAGIIASLSLSIPAYAMPAQAIPETPSLTYMDGPERVPTNPGPFPIRATPQDLSELEASENEEASSTPETPSDSEASEPPDNSSGIENEGTENPEPTAPIEPDKDPDNSGAGGEPELPDTPKDPETPVEPEPPAITDETLAADVSAIRESLGVYIENQRPFFADDTEKQYFFDNLAAVRKDLDFLLYVVIPVSAAVLIIYKFCIWFYHTFVGSVLE